MSITSRKLSSFIFLPVQYNYSIQVQINLKIPEKYFREFFFIILDNLSKKY